MPATGYEPAPALRPRTRAGRGARTSMRTALILLFLLALASIPGSVVPQEAVDSVRASQWRDQHPELTPIYEKLGLFSVYDSVWFSAIYILLMISLVGCFVPRLRVYWRGVRAQPPKAPKNLSRLPEHREVEVVSTGSTTGEGSTTETAAAWLKRKARAGWWFRQAQPPGTARPPGSAPLPRSGDTCARRATCCSTSRCWSSWSGSRSAGSSGSRVA